MVSDESIYKEKEQSVQDTHVHNQVAKVRGLAKRQIIFYVKILIQSLNQYDLCRNISEIGC